MSIATARIGSSDRFREARSLLSIIKAREQEEQLRITDDTKILRGLFWVHVYAAFEFSINSIAQEALREIQSKNVLHSHFESRFNSIALNRLFQSHDQSPKKFKKRIELLDIQASNVACQLDDSVFSSKLQNIWADDVLELCDCFCLAPLPSFDRLAQIRINEVVERRNAVAHGRESPIDAGSRTNCSGLELRLIATQRLAEDLADEMERNISSFSFVKTSDRTSYIPVTADPAA